MTFLIKVEGVRKKFCRSLKKSLWYGMNDMAAEMVGGSRQHDHLRPDEFWAVKDISFELRRGQCLGLIGRNGAGKTTLLRMLNGLIKPDHGRIEMRGRVGALIALGAGFNPILTGRENIYVNGSVLGLTKKEIDEKMDEIIDFAEIGEFIDSPVQSYSSGMQVRLGFSIATTIEPDVLLLDEVLAVGDVAFRAKCFNRLGKILSRCAVIFVTHAFDQVYRICNTVIVLRRGEIDLQGTPQEAISRYEADGLAQTLPQSALLLDKSVQSYEMFLPKLKIHAGETFAIQIRVKSNTPIRPGMLVFNMTAHDGTLAAERRQVMEPVEIKPGVDWTYEMSLGPIFLRQGIYSYNTVLFDESKNVNLAHSVSAGLLEIINPLGTQAITTL